MGDEAEDGRASLVVSGGRLVVGVAGSVQDDVQLVAGLVVVRPSVVWSLASARQTSAARPRRSQSFDMVGRVN